MNPNTRRDLLIGGAVVIVGVGLLIFAFFGNDEAFRAPRWVVAVAAVAFLLGGWIPLHHAFQDEALHPRGALAHSIVAVVLLAGAALAAWLIVGVGPEGVTLDIPVPFSADTERSVKSVVFHAILWTALVAAFAGAAMAFKRALPGLGHTVIVAVVASVAGLLAWIAIEFYRQAAPPAAPALSLTFDRKFPGDDYLARVYGKDIAARPGRAGSGLFVGGNGDWLEVETPIGFNTSHGLTLEFWMRRENWLNPYVKGSRTQTVATLELEREWKGRPEVRHIAFSLALSGPPEVAETRQRRGVRDLRPEQFEFRPTAHIGDVRLTALRSVAVPALRWTHVAIVYDRFLLDRMRLYVDGRLVARALPWSSAPGFADLRTLRLGTWVERNGAYRGMVDEVKIYARALREDEIAASAAGGY